MHDRLSPRTVLSRTQFVQLKTQRLLWRSAFVRSNPTRASWATVSADLGSADSNPETVPCENVFLCGPSLLLGLRV